MLTWHSHTSKSREKWPGICRECKSLWIICFLLNIVVVELVRGEDFEWPYICERQHTICRSNIELFKRDNVLPLTIYTVRYVQCATTPNSKQPKRKVFDFGYFMLMLLCFLIHLVWNSWHIFRCTLQIIVVHRLGSVIVFYVFFVVCFAFISFTAGTCIVICLHANGFLWCIYGSEKPYHWPYGKCKRSLFSFIFPPIPLFFVLHIFTNILKLFRDQRDITYFWQFTVDTVLAVNWAHAMWILSNKNEFVKCK